MKPLTYIGLVMSVAALWVMVPQFANAEEPVAVQGTMVLTITNNDITGGQDMSVAGLYIVTVRNESDQARGLVIKGIDLCCSPYTRFTNVLKQGQEVTFRWYFPASRSVNIRDILRCKPAQRTCYAPLLGSINRSMTF